MKKETPEYATVHFSFRLKPSDAKRLSKWAAKKNIPAGILVRQMVLAEIDKSEK